MTDTDRKVFLSIHLHPLCNGSKIRNDLNT